MKFSDDLLKSVSAILEAKPRVSFDGDKATVHSKNGTPMKSFSKKDLGNDFRKQADNFLSQNYKKLNAESVIVEELEEAKQLELPGMEKKPKQLELPFGKKDDKKKAVKESEDQLDEISKGTMGSYVKKASDDIANRAYHSGGDRHDNEFNSNEKTPERKKLLNRQKGINTAVKKLTKESEDVNTSNAAKATMHDCANHVRHEEYGLGQTIPTMHTLEEDEDGNGYVTHYDVMFQGEDGPFIIEDVWVEDLEIISEKHHGHPKGKKKMSEDVEAIDEKKGHKKDKGDMDGDGIDEPDDKEYMDNKDKAIKAAMSKKKSESPIKKVQEGFTPIGKSGEHNVHHTDSSDLNFKSRHASKVSHGGKGSDEAGENQQHYKFKDHKIDINDNHTNTKLSHVQQRVKASGVDPKHHDAVSKSIHKHITAESVEIEEADQAAFANRRAQVAKQRQDRQAQIDKQRQAKQSDFAKRRAGINEAPKYIPGFMGADGKPTSKPTQKDYDSNKEYQHMKRKLGDRIPGPPAKKINKEHLESISTALQEISKKTLQNYVGKAKEDMAHHQNVQRAADKGNVPKSDPAVQFHKKEEKKRKVGMDRAKNRLAKESNEYTDDLADRIRSHENKKERKKAEKAFTAGDYEKATGHIGGTYREK